MLLCTLRNAFRENGESRIRPLHHRVYPLYPHDVIHLVLLKIGEKRFSIPSGFGFY